jgi:hypothetical protein
VTARVRRQVLDELRRNALVDGKSVNAVVGELIRDYNERIAARPVPRGPDVGGFRVRRALDEHRELTERCCEVVDRRIALERERAR